MAFGDRGRGGGRGGFRGGRGGPPGRGGRGGARGAPGGRGTFAHCSLGSHTPYSDMSFLLLQAPVVVLVALRVVDAVHPVVAEPREVVLVAAVR